MKMVSMTEFNQHPSRIARLAADDDVIVLRHGVQVLRITRIDNASTDPLDRLMRAGLAHPPRTPAAKEPLPSIRTDADLDALLADDRGRLDD